MNLDIKWKDYCKENKTDCLYLQSLDGSKLIRIAEGDGEALEEEDLQDGYNDYWYIEVYQEFEYNDFHGAANIGGGYLMTKQLIQDENPSILQIVDTIIERKEELDGLEDLDETHFLILEENFGSKIEKRMEDLCDQYMDHYRKLDPHEGMAMNAFLDRLKKDHLSVEEEEEKDGI